MMEQWMDLLSGYLNSTTYAVVAVLYVLMVIAWWKIFEKAGERGWKALIPVYNLFVLVRIIDNHAWKALLLLIPLVGEIYAILLQFRLAKVFGKGVGFGLGLLFLNTIFSLILAFSDARYRGTQE